MIKITAIIVCLSLCLSFIKGENKKTQILAKLFKDYDESVLPTVEDTDLSDDDPEPPVIVAVNMYLRRIEVNDVEQEQTVQLTFRQFWTDRRLAYEAEDDAEKLPQFIIVDQDKPEYKIWKPDTFFPNDVEDDNDDSGHADSVIKISPKGEVIYSQRFTSSFSCPMTAEEYPFDEQSCTMDVASYGFTSDDVKYIWQENPITLKAGLNRSISGYELTHYNTSYCTSRTNTGEYSCLRVYLYFDRTKSMETHKIFGYSIALVVASWIPFWLKPFDTAARAIIGVALLATTVIFNHLVLDESIIENVAYTTPVHVWTDATLGFVFLALVQLAFVVLLSPRNVPCVSAVGLGHEHGEVLIKRKATDETNEKIFSVPFKEYHWGKRFDIFCRIIFPLSYGIFNIVFWSIYSE